MRQVLQVLPAFESGGVEHYVLDLLNNIADRYPKETFYVASNGGKLVEQLRKNIVHINIPFHKKSPWAMYQNYLFLEKICKQYSVQHVHAHSRAPAWACYFLFKKTGLSYSTTFHGAHGGQNIFKKKYNRVLLNGDFTIAISDFIEQHLKENYYAKAPQVIKICEGIDTTFFDPEKFTHQDCLDVYNTLGIPFYHRIIFMPGRFSKNKGHHFVLEAVKNIKDVSIVFAGKYDHGEQYVQQLKNYATTHQLDAYFLTAIHDVRPFYRAAHVTINNSLKPEAFGRVMAEALAMKSPLIATNMGGAKELTNNGAFGCLVEPGDVAALKNTIEKTLDNNNLNKNILQEGRNHIRKQYNLQIMIDGILQHVYNV